MPDFDLCEMIKKAVTKQGKFWDFRCHLIALILGYNSVVKSWKESRESQNQKKVAEKITSKIFETNSSFEVKQGIMEKV